MMVHMCSHRSDSLTCQGLYNDKQKQTQQQKYTTKKKKNLSFCVIALVSNHLLVAVT